MRSTRGAGRGPVGDDERWRAEDRARLAWMVAVVVGTVLVCELVLLIKEVW